METLLYEVKPYLLLGMGGGAEVVHRFSSAGLTSEIGIASAYALGALGGFILGMRFTARRASKKIPSRTRTA